MIRYKGHMYREAKGRAPLELTPNTIEQLKASDWVVVYHGTRHPEDLIHGVDATAARHKIYPINTPGLFVAPTLTDALEWGPFVFELVVAAKNLHGTYYDGKIERQDPAWHEFAQKKYPESFRPELSETLQSTNTEPQALLIGTVGPHQIRAVYTRPYERAVGSGEYEKKYSREEFIQEYKHMPVPAWFNPHSTNIAPEAFFRALAEAAGYSLEESIDSFVVYADNEEFLLHLLQEGVGELGLSDKAAQALLPKLIDYLISLQ